MESKRFEITETEGSVKGFYLRSYLLIYRLARIAAYDNFHNVPPMSIIVLIVQVHYIHLKQVCQEEGLCIYRRY